MTGGVLTTAFAVAGLTVTHGEVLGTEWREYVEERDRPASTALLRLATERRSGGGLLALDVEVAADGQASGSTSGCVNRTGLPSDRA
ncbi:hypothetical protein Lfu02_41430 [Longispora fulva]|uniref:Uncharacterized protein n=1 Tax=Longispora fulva TaxID=619741 RepID=A0A8J7KPR1_9ACTN|nr:hypothetical protein [Longispora fulva]GIG59771.1 hypothetical protein Lfu02_41430 [Longispora fulva]